MALEPETEPETECAECGGAFSAIEYEGIICPYCIAKAEKQPEARSNVWRWHLAVQNLRSTGRLGRSVKFNKLGWEKYCVQLRAQLMALSQENEK